MEFIDNYIHQEESLNEECSKSTAAADTTPENVVVPKSRRCSSKPKDYKMNLSGVDFAMIQEIRNSHPSIYVGPIGKNTEPKRDEAFHKIAATILDKQYLASTPDACNKLFVILVLIINS